MHVGRSLVLAQSHESRASEQTLLRPPHEGDLDDRRRLPPAERLHVVGGDALAPPRSSAAVGQVDEWTAGSWSERNPREDLGSEMRGKARADRAREVQASLVESTRRVPTRTRAIGLVAPDDELLLWAELDLDPRLAALASAIHGIAALGDHGWMVPSQVFLVARHEPDTSALEHRSRNHGHTGAR